MSDVASQAAEPAEKGIVQLAAAAGPKNAVRRRPRRTWLIATFILVCLLPSILGAAYFLVLASDRYASSTGFTVRGFEAGGGIDVVGAFTGLAGTGSTTSDSYIVLQYLQSRDLIERLQQEFDLEAVYGNPSIDAISRLMPDPSMEELVHYWQRQIKTTFDATSGIISVEVRAFSPDAAVALTDAVLGYTRELVNRLSEDARNDTLRFATAEVARSEDRLRGALEAVRAFREREQSLNPSASAEVQIEILAELERQLLTVRSRMAAFGDRVTLNTPAMLSLRRQAETLEAQISDRRQASTGLGAAPNEPAALSQQLAAFEALEIEKGFAQQSYASALSSLEQARADADRQQRYLAVYSQPALAQDPAYPRRYINTALVIAAALAIWTIGTMITYAVRDHLA